MSASTKGAARSSEIMRRKVRELLALNPKVGPGEVARVTGKTRKYARLILDQERATLTTTEGATQ